MLVGSLGLHLSHHPDVPLPRALAVLQGLATQLQARGESTRLDDPLWTACDGGAECAAQIQGRLGTDAVSFISVYEGVTTLRVVARLGETEHRAELPLSPDAWGPGLEGLALALVPDAPPPAPLDLTLEPPPPAPPRYAPWLLSGASLLAAGGAVAFGLSAKHSQADLQMGPRPGPDAQGLIDRQKSHAWAANILLGSAVALAVGAGISFIVD